MLRQVIRTVKQVIRTVKQVVRTVRQIFSAFPLIEVGTRDLRPSYPCRDLRAVEIHRVVPGSVLKKGRLKFLETLAKRWKLEEPVSSSGDYLAPRWIYTGSVGLF